MLLPGAALLRQHVVSRGPRLLDPWLPVPGGGHAPASGKGAAGSESGACVTLGICFLS